MGDGWETRRRRDDGNDWIVAQLATRGRVTHATIDTSYFIGNSPGSARLQGIDATAGDLDAPGAWLDLLPRTRLQRDTPHRFRITTTQPVTHVRLDIHPDGGLARLRLFGGPTPDGLAALGLRWFDLLPVGQASDILTAECDAPAGWAREFAAARPFSDPAGPRKALEAAEPVVAARVRGLLGVTP
jgi:allantoicase